MQRGDHKVLVLDKTLCFTRQSGAGVEEHKATQAVPMFCMTHEKWRMNGQNNEAVHKFKYLRLILESTRGLNKQETLVKMKGYKLL